MSSVPTTKTLRAAFRSTVGTYDPRPPLFHRPVKITSPEQFVPIYLANSLYQDKESTMGYPSQAKSIPDSIYIEPKSFLSKKIARKKLTSNIKKWLYQDITEYTLPIYHINAGMHATFSQAQYGGYVSGSIVALFGFYGIRFTINQSYVKSTHYKYLDTKQSDVTSTVHPKAIVVVKAKHLNQIRLGLWLNNPKKIHIPYSGIKMMIETNESIHLYLPRQEELSICFKKEYCSQKTLNDLVGLIDTSEIPLSIKDRIELARVSNLQPTTV